MTNTSLARTYYERHAIASYLASTLDTSWSISEIREGFQSEKDIIVPMIAVHARPGRFHELQMGRSVSGEKSFSRLFQIDCYMENEPRAMAIGDDVGDIVDQMNIGIVDPSNTPLGSLFCPNSEEIVITVLPPNLADVKLKRWRAVIQFPIEVNYIV